ELESAPSQVSAHGLRLRGFCRKIVVVLPSVLDGTAADEAPKISIKAAKFLLHLQVGSSVLDRRLYLKPVSDDAGIGEQLHDPLRCEPRNRVRLEVRESGPVAIAFLENCFPAQSGLGALQHQEFEETAVIVLRHAPFLVMITDDGLSPRPVASSH